MQGYRFQFNGTVLYLVMRQPVPELVNHMQLFIEGKAVIYNYMSGACIKKQVVKTTCVSHEKNSITAAVYSVRG